MSQPFAFNNISLDSASVNSATREQATSVVYTTFLHHGANSRRLLGEALSNLEHGFWVNPLMWVPVSATAGVPTAAGYLSVTTTATPKKLIFDPGDGALAQGQLPARVQEFPGSKYLATHSIAVHVHLPTLISLHEDGAFPATLAVQWHITFTPTLEHVEPLVISRLKHHTKWSFAKFRHSSRLVNKGCIE